MMVTKVAERVWDRFIREVRVVKGAFDCGLNQSEAV